MLMVNFHIYTLKMYTAATLCQQEYLLHHWQLYSSHARLVHMLLASCS